MGATCGKTAPMGNNSRKEQWTAGPGNSKSLATASTAAPTNRQSIADGHAEVASCSSSDLVPPANLPANECASAGGADHKICDQDKSECHKGEASEFENRDEQPQPVANDQALVAAADDADADRGAKVATETKRKEIEGKTEAASTFSVDEETASRIRTFYERNRRENQRHATMMARSEADNMMRMLLAETEGGNQRVEQYDVFSPDMRSTRWAEFLQLFAEDSQKFDRFKESSAVIRGTGKAMTLGAVRRNAEAQELH